VPLEPAAHEWAGPSTPPDLELSGGAEPVSIPDGGHPQAGGVSFDHQTGLSCIELGEEMTDEAVVDLILKQL